MADEARTTDGDAGEIDGTGASRSRRRLLGQAAGGAGLIALSATGAFALRRADASDDDNDDDDDDDNSGSGSGGGDGDNSGHGGDDHDDDDHDDRDDDDGLDRRVDDDVTLTGTVPAGAAEVWIVDDDADGFSPGDLTVDLGATIAFVNADDDPHTATGSGFDTGAIQPGAVATVTLDEPGTFPYACLIHPEMTGAISVRDAGGQVPTAATPAATPGATPSAGGGTETVAIRDFAFDPAELTVPAGTTVTWTNADSATHTATGEDGTFDAGTIDGGASGGATFAEPGTFPYICAFHPNMQGTIVVE